MKRLTLSLLICFSFLELANAQIGGISGSKLASYCVDVVDHKHIEFEPGLYRSVANTFWDEAGNQHNTFKTPDSLNVSSEMYIRMTYGLWNKLEFGFNISDDLITSNWGMRYILLQKEKIGLAAIAGANLPIASKKINKNIDLSTIQYSWGAGIVSTVNLNQQLSFDFTYQYLVPFKVTNWENEKNQFINLDVGYYIHNYHFQLIGGIGYCRMQNDKRTSNLLTLCHGATIETERYIIVICLPVDIYGKNIDKSRGLLLALTLTF